MNTEVPEGLGWAKAVMRGVPATDGHCSCTVNGRIYVFGGVEHTKYDYHETNKMAIACPMDQKYEVLSVSGDLPRCRSSAAMAAVGKSLHLFGGLNCESGWLDDFHVFDTETNIWKQAQASGHKPSPRDKVSSAVVGNKIYFFGGFGPLSEVQVQKALHNRDSSDEDDSDDDQTAKFGWFNDLFIFDTTSKTWSKVEHPIANSPSPRAASSMCSVGSSLLVFGGRDKEGRCNDLHIFDTASSAWTKVTSTGSIPEPRSFHSAAVIGKLMFVVGGMSQNDGHFADVHVFDFDETCWTKLNVTEEFSGRGRFTLDVVGDTLVVFGGSGKFSKETNQCCTFFNDFYLLNTSNLIGDLQSINKSAASVDSSFHQNT